MKKQYYVSDTYRLKCDIILYHDGEKVETKGVWLDEVDSVLEELERNGYSRGYLPKQIEKIYERYLFMKLNEI